MEIGAGNSLLHRLFSTEHSAEDYQARSNELLTEITGVVRNQTCFLSIGHKHQPFSSPVIDSSKEVRIFIMLNSREYFGESFADTDLSAQDSGCFRRITWSPSRHRYSLRRRL